MAHRCECAAHVEADRFFGFIESGFIEPWKPESQTQNEVVMRIVADAAAGYAAAGYFTVVEGIVIPRWFLTPLRQALEAAGHQVAYAVLRVPLDVCVARRPAIEREVVENLWRQFDDLGELADHAVDTNSASPESVAAELSGRLKSGSLTLGLR